MPGTVEHPTPRALHRTWRWPILACCIVSALSLVMGPLLFLKAQKGIEGNARVICGIGRLFSHSPKIQRAPGQSKGDFHKARRALRQFLIDLRLGDCAGINVEQLKRHLGVDQQKGVTPGGGNSPSGQPPPSGSGQGAEPPNVHLPGTSLTPPLDVCLPPRQPLCS